MPSTADQIANLDAELDALSTPTTAQVLAHTQDYDADVVAASAAQRAINGGGSPGGSQAVLVTDPLPISAAEILNSFTAKKVIIAGIPGKVIVPFHHFGIYTSHGTPYDVSGAGNFIVGVAGDPAFPDVSLGGFGAANTVLLVDAIKDVAGGAALADWEGEDIIWGFDTANPINGNGTWSWQMWYALVDV